MDYNAGEFETSAREKMLRKKRVRGRNNIGFNGRSLCENTLNKGKPYFASKGIINPAVFKNINLGQFKSVCTKKVMINNHY